jgi:hypothetical protein
MIFHAYPKQDNNNNINFYFTWFCITGTRGTVTRESTPERRPPRKHRGEEEHYGLEKKLVRNWELLRTQSLRRLRFL